MKNAEKQYEKMTQTSVQKLIVSLSAPTILTMLVTNLYNLADTAFVGMLGTSASGAVGIVFGFMSILQAIGFMFGQGGGSIMSQKLGQKKELEASIYASTGFFTAFFLAAIVELISLARLDALVKLLGSTPTIAPYAKTYVLCIVSVAPFVVTSFTLNNILRYEGKAVLGMIGMLTGAILNVGGDALLIFGFKMGIAGAGIATAVSQLVSFIILISMFLRGKTQSRLSLRLALTHGESTVQRACFKCLYDVSTTGFPSLIRQGCNSLATVILNVEAAVYGDEAVAAMSIVSRIVFFIMSIAIGIGQGFQPVSAFNYGAGKYRRVYKAYWFTFLFAESLVIVMACVLLSVSGGMIQLFRDDATVIEMGTRALRLQAFGSIFIPFCIVTEMLLQSTGRKLTATLLSGCRSGFIFIPVLLILAKFRGLAGIQEAQMWAFILSVLPTMVVARLFWKKIPMEKENQ